jgi:hypothetical protein
MKKTPELSIVESGAIGVSTRRKPDSRGTKLKRSIIDEYGVDDPANLELLEQISAAVDRLDAVEQRIARDGVMTRGERGLRPHPLLKTEATLRGFIVRSIGRLGVAP